MGISPAKMANRRYAKRIERNKPIFVELKSRTGVASSAEAKLKPPGANWWLARGASAALMALRL
jgi:hypothetical protein